MFFRRYFFALLYHLVTNGRGAHHQSPRDAQYVSLRQHLLPESIPSVKIEDTRSNFFPLSAAYQEDHGSHSNLGRFALRVRSESDNPAQLVYINNDWRIGGDAEKTKLCYTLQVSDNILTSIRSEFDYNSSDVIDFWANLHYQYSPSTRLHLLLGDHIDLAGGTVLYPMVSTPMALRAEEDSLGVMFYVEHLF